MNKLNRVILALIVLVCSAKAEDWTIPRLSPMPVKQEIEQISLNGTWQFNPSPGKASRESTDTGWHKIEVPGEWVMQGFEVEKGEQAAYRRTFTVPADWQDKRIKLRCNGIFSESQIYINGNEAGYHLGGFTPFELDITPHAHVGKENQITIRVRSESLADSTASASRYAVHPLGGITRDIFLFTLPETNLSSFHASTRFDSTYTDAVLTAEVEVTHEGRPKEKDTYLLFSLTDATGKEIPLKENKKKIPAGASEKTYRSHIEFEIEKPHKWNPEQPYLYTFSCRLVSDDKVLHTTARRIGFRQIEVRGNQLFVNNMPVKLRGVCRHEVMPLRGRSLTGDIWRKDVELFRKGNVNYIRTSHYPPDEALLDACDELGMFVEMEAPFCWAHETKVPEEKHYEVLVNQHIEMVNRDKSHPSVIIWSMGNESNLYTEYFKRSAEIVKIMDPTRPRIFSQWSPDSDNGELEIANHHYPGPKGPEMYRNSKRPVTFDEFCHLNAYNRLELAADPGVRSMWGKLLDRMWDAMYKSKGVLGGALWAGIDDTFFLPGGKAVGYGTWGPIDGWRREKPEYWEMKKAFSPVRIRQTGNLEKDNSITFEVENRFNFLNLADCSFRWQIKGMKGDVSVEAPPHSSGTFRIQLPGMISPDDKLSLTVTDCSGTVVDEYEFSVLPQKITSPSQKNGKLSYSEKNGFIEINTLSGKYRVDQKHGLLSSYDTRNKQTLISTPHLMVLPLNPEGEGIQMTGKDQNFKPYTPICSHWICESIEKTFDGNNLEIKVKGQYQEAEGSFLYRIQPDGMISVHYDFKVSEEISPRQTGLVFSLPDNYNRLTWERKGYWNVYPDNHIAKLRGTADAFDNQVAISGIAGPDKQPSVDWSFDQTENGSNMFRSTKENILQVSLTDKADNGLYIFSDGNQHSRSWKEADRTYLLIADYNNAGNERFLVSHAEKFYRPLKSGDRITGTVVFQIR